MPIYEYDCEVCGRFELIQKASDKPLKECPTCKEKGRKQKVSRAVSAAAFHLKGSGWYKTDYASNGQSPTKTSAAVDTTKSTDSDKTPTKAESNEKPKSDAPKSGGKCGSGCGCH